MTDPDSTAYPLRIRWPLLVVVIVVLSLEAALADEVIMHNGDRLTGEVIRQDEGRLRLKTAYAGTLNIDWEQVSAVRLDEAREALFDDETVLAVTAVSRHDGRLTLQQDSPTKPMTVDEARVKAIEPERVTARQIEAARRALTRHMKRQGRVWIRIFPDKPITAKPAETRMGKGKGTSLW